MALHCLEDITSLAASPPKVNFHDFLPIYCLSREGCEEIRNSAHTQGKCGTSWYVFFNDLFELCSPIIFLFMKEAQASVQEPSGALRDRGWDQGMKYPLGFTPINELFATDLF